MVVVAVVDGFVVVGATVVVVVSCVVVPAVDATVVVVVAAVVVAVVGADVPVVEDCVLVDVSSVDTSRQPVRPKEKRMANVVKHRRQNKRVFIRITLPVRQVTPPAGCLRATA